MSLYNSLNSKIPMRLQGYNPLYYNGKPVNPENYYHLSLSNVDYQKQYDFFKEKIYNSVSKTFLPVYRMSDGEFNFCLHKTNLKKKIISRLMPEYHYLRTCWGENYTLNEIRKEMPGYIENIRKISEDGFLALHFADGEQFKKYREYINPMCNWFEKHEIKLTCSNYISFYMVYALLSDTDSFKIFRNKRILIITSNTGKRFNKLEREIQLKYSPAKILFYEISSGKSISDKINLAVINERIDLILVGAGIGSANILMQLNSLNTVCIDAGIFLDSLIDNSLTSSRLFLKEAEKII